MIEVQWCSICNTAPAVGVAACVDVNGDTIDLPLCLECVRSLTPSSQQYSLGIN